MTEEEVNAKLEEKNQELFFNKLKIDLEKCYKNLIVVINNILDAFQKDMELRVYEISFDAESLLSRDDINNRIKPFFDKMREYCSKTNESNLKLLIASIENKDLEKYGNDLDTYGNNFINGISTLYLEGIDLLIKSISVEMDAYSKIRMNKILKELIYSHFIERLSSTINDTNSIIKNNVTNNTSYLENMNKSTLKAY